MNIDQKCEYPGCLSPAVDFIEHDRQGTRTWLCQEHLDLPLAREERRNSEQGE
jgi:hypothetical protein